MPWGGAGSEAFEMWLRPGLRGIEGDGEEGAPWREGLQQWVGRVVIVIILMVVGVEIEGKNEGFASVR